MDPNAITYFGETDARNKKIRFGIKAKDRLKHMYIIGKTGMGKSTLLENMAIQDIQNGNGMAFLDPHGGTADKLLDYVPESRIKDVLYFAPFDMDYPIAFNVMEDTGIEKRHLVLSGLMSAFKKLFGEESFSDRMQYILQNTILALLEYPGATMLGINKMLSDKEYRKKVIANITDPSVKDYWTKEYAGYTERFAAEAIPAIQNKIGQFTSNPLVRNIIGQEKSTFDIRKFMDEKKILIINLSKGRVGEGNANLLGSMLITKIYLAAMSRADKNENDLAKLPNFYLYVDEFQSFANKSFADILSEARKYKLNLTIAHQYIEQMEEEVRDAVFGNVGTMITFRVGAFDAEVLEKEFAPTFTAEDLVNLGFAQIYLKLMIDGVSSHPFSSTTMKPIARSEYIYKDQIISASRATFARPRAVVEKEIQDWLAPVSAQPTSSQSANNQPNNFNNQNKRQLNNSQKTFQSSNTNFDNRSFKDQPANIQPAVSTTRSNSFFPQIKNPTLEIADNQKINDVAPIKVTAPKIEEDTVERNKQIFLKASQELATRVIPSPEVVLTKPQTPQPLSLDKLKTDHERAKNPTPENITNLKEALSSVFKKTEVQQPTKTSVEPTPSLPKVEIDTKAKTESKPENTQNINTSVKNEPNTAPQKTILEKEAIKPEVERSMVSETAVREIPENILRSVLQMDEK